ncbi:MAG: hypothetical protein AAF570_11390 [Bacteroidota bacterium]
MLFGLVELVEDFELLVFELSGEFVVEFGGDFTVVKAQVEVVDFGFDFFEALFEGLDSF